MSSFPVYIFDSSCSSRWEESVRPLADTVIVFGRDPVSVEMMHRIFGPNVDDFPDTDFEGGGIVISGDEKVVIIILRGSMGGLKLSDDEKMALLGDHLSPRRWWRRRTDEDLFAKVESRLMDEGARRIDLKRDEYPTEFD